MTTETLVAIDPSLTGMAVCVWKRSGGELTPHSLTRHESKATDGSVVQRLARYQSLASQAADAVFNNKARLVLIEGYSHDSRHGLVYSGEFGAILRYLITKAYDCQIIEVAPTTLKKFTTGKGKGQKEGMAAHVAKRWGQIFDTNDETDAYALAQLGRRIAGWQGCDNQAQEEAVAAALGGKPKKKRKAAV